MMINQEISMIVDPINDLKNTQQILYFIKIITLHQDKWFLIE